MDLEAAGIRRSGHTGWGFGALVLAVLSCSTGAAFGQATNEITSIDPDSGAQGTRRNHTCNDVRAIVHTVKKIKNQCQCKQCVYQWSFTPLRILLLAMGKVIMIQFTIPGWCWCLNECVCEVSAQ